MKLALILSLLPITAFATTQPSQPDPQATSTSSATGGHAEASGGYATADNAVGVSVTDRKQAPSISAPAVYASGSCAYGVSAGLSIPGAGISGGRTKPDEACNRREIVRILATLNPALALKVACTDPLVQAVASGDDCKYVPPTVAGHFSAEASVAHEPPPLTKEASEPATAAALPKCETAFKQCVSK